MSTSVQAPNGSLLRTSGPAWKGRGERIFELVEFRNYRIKRGRAKEFARYFDEQGFPEALERCGVTVWGQFEVVDDPDRFVWVRAFQRADERGPSLAKFYTSQFWKARRTETNELLFEYDNVFLLRPDRSRPTFGAHPAEATAVAQDQRVVLALIAYQSGAVAELTSDQSDLLDRLLLIHSGSELGRLVSAEVENDYPRLPLRDETVFLWLVRTPGPEEASALAKDSMRVFGERVESMVLRPTARSLLT